MVVTPPRAAAPVPAPVVAGDGAAERQLRVNVYIDAAGMTYLPVASTTLARWPIGPARADSGNLLTANGDIGLSYVGVKNSAIGNDEVVCHD